MRPPRTHPLDLMERVALMAPETMTAAAAETTRQALVQHQAAHRVGNADMGRVVGCAASTWSQIRGGTYRGDVVKYMTRGRRWLTERLARGDRPDAAGGDYVETTVARRILAACQRAWSMPCIARIVTPSGAGKTAALREFCRRRADRAVYLQAGELFSTKTALIRRLAALLRIPPRRKAGGAELYEAVRERLADFYAGGMQTPITVVVDEATTLRPAALNVLRGLHDDPDCRAAVVLADTARLDGELRSRRGIAGGYEQLRSRFGAVYTMTEADAVPLADVRAVAGAVAAGLGHDRPLDRHAVRYLAGLAGRPGRFRNVVHRLWAVHDLAERSGVAPAYDVPQLDFAASLVGMPCEMDHAEVPFGRPAPAPAARKAG